MKLFTFTLFLFLFSLQAFSVTKTAVANNGNGWGVASNWSPSGIPQSGDSIIIPSGFTLSVKGNIYSSLPNFYLLIRGTLDFDPSGKLELGVNSSINIPSGGRITSNGTSSEIIKINGTVMFNGSLDGTITGPKHSMSSYGPSPNGFMPGVLPVKLLSFTAIKSDRIIILKWTTVSEINTKNFEIERSSNGSDWSVIQVVEAAGNSSIEKNYSSSDSNPGKGKNYYRLKTIDQDGKHEYSKLLLVSAETETVKMNIFPNPATTTVTISLNGFNGDLPTALLLVNHDGKTIKQLPVTGNSSNITIDLSNLQKGIYNLVVASMSGNRHSQKLIIK